MVYPTLSEQARQNPDEILAAIEVLRPQAGGGVDASESLARRRPGRPGWTEAELLTHWRAAEAEAQSQRMADIAACFRGLGGTKGVNPNYLRRLPHQLKKRTETPE
jgi:hypothetical protein